MVLSESQKKKIEEEEKYRAQVKAAISPTRAKNKLVAGLLAIFLGGLGIHKFYLGRIGWGILYLIFFWTFIPAIIGFIEGIIYLSMSDASFAHKYSESNSSKQSSGVGKIFLIIFASLIVLTIASSVYFNNLASKNPTNINDDYSINIGKEAYNKTSGVYRGKITKVKPCNTDSAITCYVLKSPDNSRPIEAPVDNVEVKEEKE